MTQRLTKHHGAGNDFLVWHRSEPVAPEVARALCDRRFGVGADGLLRLDRGVESDLLMELTNADGSPAEMSGNGIRCLVQAAVFDGLVDGDTDAVTVLTGAGVRTVAYRVVSPTEGWAEVEMGVVTDWGDCPAPEGALRAARAEIGNPHLVLEWGADFSLLDVDALGGPLSRGGGTNVEFIRRGTDGADLDLAVYERGVGPTLACGTGTSAASVIARRWGLVGDALTVANPGGRLTVALGADGAATLGGPVVFVAEILLP